GGNIPGAGAAAPVPDLAALQRGNPAAAGAAAEDPAQRRRHGARTGSQLGPVANSHALPGKMDASARRPARPAPAPGPGSQPVGPDPAAEIGRASSREKRYSS